MTNLLRLLSTGSWAIGIAVAAAFADPATLTQARSYIGTEAALEAVASLRFSGQLEVVDSTSEKSDGPVSIELCFQKPDRQRITITRGTRVETTALDGYDAWQLVSDTEDPSVWRVNLLGPDRINRLRATAFENLGFFRGLEDMGGRIEDLGSAQMDGIDCHKLSFVHGPAIVFTRWFDRATGRVILTRTETGTDIREEGEIRSGGLRFPKRIITKHADTADSLRHLRVTFDQIEVNPKLDASLFSVPPFRAPEAKPE